MNRTITTQGMIGSPTDAQWAVEELQQMWRAMNGEALFDELYHWRDDEETHAKSADRGTQYQIPDSSEPGINPVFILFSHDIGTPLRADTKPAGWGDLPKWLRDKGYGHIALFGVGGYVEMYAPPEGTIPMTGTLYELFRALGSHQETFLRVYDLSRVITIVPEDMTERQKQRQDWLLEFLDTEAGKGITNSHKIHCPETLAEMRVLMRHDLQNAFEIAPLDPVNDPLPSLEAVRAHEPLLFGRTRTIKALTKRVFDEKAPVTLVTGISGTGKSSLLRAGAMGRWFKRAPYGAGLEHRAHAILVDPDMLVPTTKEDNPVALMKDAQPLHALYEALTMTAPEPGTGMSKNELSMKQVGPFPMSLATHVSPPLATGDRTCDVDEALRWWSDYRGHFQGPFVLVLDQVERIKAQLKTAEECLAERAAVVAGAGTELDDESLLDLSPGYAQFLGLLCRLTGLDGNAAADPDFHLVAGLHRLSSLNLWPIIEDETGKQILPDCNQVSPLATLDEWKELIEGTFRAYGLSLDIALLSSMAEEAEYLVREPASMSQRAGKSAQDDSISDASVLPQVKVAIQRVLMAWQSLPEPRTMKIDYPRFQKWARIANAIDDLGEEAWSSYKRNLASTLSLDLRATLDQRRVEYLMQMRFGALMRAMIDSSGRIVNERATVELSTVSRNSDVIKNAPELRDALLDFRLLTGGTSTDFRLPHRTLLYYWKRAKDFIEENDERLKLKTIVSSASFGHLNEEWYALNEDALVDLALNWVGNGEADDKDHQQALCHTLAERFDGLSFSFDHDTALGLLPYQLLLKREFERIVPFLSVIIRANAEKMAEPSENLVQLCCVAAQVGATRCLEDLINAVPLLLDAQDRAGRFPLLIAAKNGHTEAVHALTNAGANVNAVEPNTGMFPLLMAVQQGYTEAVHALIGAEADVNEVNRSTGNFPLLMAAQNGHTEAVFALISAGADVNALDSTYGTFPLLMAAEYGHTAAVRALIASGADIDAVNLVTGDFPLLMAAQNGHAEAVHALLAAGADVTARNRNPTSGAFPLLQAAQNGHTQVVHALLAAGADVTAQNHTNGAFPLLMAAQDGHTEAVHALIAAGADIDAVATPTGLFPLLMAAQNGRTESVHALIAAGANVTAMDPNTGQFPLLQAAQNGHTEAMQALLAAGADANAMNSITGIFPLIMAAQNEHTEAVHALLVAGADANAMNSITGNFPLLMAAQKGCTFSVHALITAGADVNTMNLVTGDFPLLMAGQNGHHEVIRILLAAGASLNAVDVIEGVSPLHLAAQQGHEEVVQALTTAGADVNAVTPIGTVPLHLAALNGHTEVVQTLINASADVNVVNTTNSMFPLLLAAGRGHTDIVLQLARAGVDLNQVWQENSLNSLEICLVMLSEQDSEDYDQALANWRGVKALLEVGATLSDGTRPELPPVPELDTFNRKSKPDFIHEHLLPDSWNRLALDSEEDKLLLSNLLVGLRFSIPLWHEYELIVYQNTDSDLRNLYKVELIFLYNEALNTYTWYAWSVGRTVLIFSPDEDINAVTLSLSKLSNSPNFRRPEIAQIFACLFVLTDLKYGPSRPLPQDEPWPLLTGSKLPKSQYEEQFLRHWTWSWGRDGTVISLPVMRGTNLAREHVFVGNYGHIKRHSDPEILMQGVPFMPFSAVYMDDSVPGLATARHAQEQSTVKESAVVDALIDQLLATENFVEDLRNALSTIGYDFDALTDRQKHDAARQFLPHLQK